MSNKILGFVLSLLFVFSLSACGEISAQKPIIDDESKQELTDDTGSLQTTTEEQATTPESESTSASAAVTIEKAVLLNQDGLVITANEIVDDSIWGMGIQVLIENSTEKNLGISCNSLIVNNYMISDLFSSSVAAGKKSNETIYLSSSGLEAAGITTISDIVLSFHVYDDDSYDTIFDSVEIELKTSAYGTVDQPVLDEGKELYNQNGIRIIGKYVNEDSFWGAGILLFIENNYGKNIVVQCDDMSINGFMVTPYFSCNINQGRMAIDDITILSSDLEDNNITSVDDIELAFIILDSETYETIAETDPIAFSTK